MKLGVLPRSSEYVEMLLDFGHLSDSEHLVTELQLLYGDKKLALLDMRSLTRVSYPKAEIMKRSSCC